MLSSEPFRRSLAPPWARLGILLLVIGEALIVARLRPLSDFYFPFVWLGYTLVLDAALFAYRGTSLLSGSRRIFFLMFPLSVTFWWVFEAFNISVHNWVYLGAERYTGLAYVAFASLDFSTVLPAIWVTALAISSLLPLASRRRDPGHVPVWLQAGSAALGVLSILLPIVLPDLAFGLIWVSLLLLLDPLNYRLGRPSILAMLWAGDWLRPLAFALAALMCGFFWEAWNFWSMPKWVYHVPHVGFFPIFEMPLMGWSGYLPFGLELFAMTNFVLFLAGVRAPVSWLEVGGGKRSGAHPVTAPSARARARVRRAP